MNQLFQRPVFQFKLSKPEAIPVVIPLAKWIIAANDDVMYTEEKR